MKKFMKTGLGMAGVVLTGLALTWCGSPQESTQADLTETYDKLLDTDRASSGR